MRSLYKLLSKTILYINKNYFVKYIDNRYWKLSDAQDSPKVSTLLKENHEDKITTYLPGTDMEWERKNNLKYYNSLIHIYSKYIYKVNDCILDPDYNWAILDRNKIFKYSFPMAEDPWDNVKPRPSLLKFLFRKKPLALEKGIMVKYGWSNYYHFFVDTLPQIMLCDKFGLLPDIPIIVPYSFPNIAHVTEYFKKINPSQRKIIVQQKNQYIRVKELYLAKDTFFSDSVIELHQKLPSLQKPSDEEKIKTPSLLFVTRNKKYKRNIKNAAEIEAIAKENGFTIIDTSEYNLSQQIILFSKARYIVGIHGAAMMNIIFSKSPKVSILELFTGKNFIPGHYSYLSRLLGYNYKSIIGDGLDSNSEFHLDEILFQNKLIEMMSE